MKFTAFKAGDGDSVLIEGAAANILVDGGRKGAFVKHVLPTLAELENAGRELDLVCVSHIDEDHINGIVDLVDRRRAWAIFDFHDDPPGSSTIDEPTRPRVPKIHQLWHNSFGDTFRDAASKVSNALGFHSQLLEASAALQDTGYSDRFGRLAQGAKKAIELELMLFHSPMGIAINQPATPTANEPPLLLTETTPATSDVNGVTVHLLGPTRQNFEDSFGDWNAWVKKNEEKIEGMREDFRTEFPTGNALDFLAFSVKQAGLGNINDVTPPNIASIMFLLEEGQKRILMTGDGAAQDIVKGLEAAPGLMAAGGGLHVDVFKAPHHGAEANTSPELARRVTADHYVFTSNGSHHNPEKEVIAAFVDGRLGPGAATHQGADQRFKLWFNYSQESSELQGDKDSQKNRRAVLKAAREEVDRLKGVHGDRFDFEFVKEGPVVIP